MCQELPFDPFPFLAHPNLQTIFNSYVNFFLEPHWTQLIVGLPDGDNLSHAITTPVGWKGTDPTVIFIHGLSGSHESPNGARMANRLEMRGIRTVRVNMRGCGSGRGLARRLYHAGRSEDILETLKVLKAQQPDSPTILIGFSMGGNVALKLVGELGSLGGHFLKGAVGINPPVQLIDSLEKFDQPEGIVYKRYFFNRLCEEVQFIQKTFKDLPPIHLPKEMSLLEFDQVYTAPWGGFIDAYDYYRKCSSAQFVKHIEIPTKILLAEDDPVIAHHSLDGMTLPPNVTLYKTKKGGHMGYVGRPSQKRGINWLDHVLIEWIEEFLN